MAGGASPLAIAARHITRIALEAFDWKHGLVCAAHPMHDVIMFELQTKTDWRTGEPIEEELKSDRYDAPF